MADRKAKEPTTKQKAWPLFDAIVAEAPFRNLNPWEGRDTFVPDYETLVRLLGVPLLLSADTTSGVPALAFDVWVAYELRRAGLDPDAVWPREEAPRIIARDIIDFTNAQYARTKTEIWARVKEGGTFGGTVGASANLLGKNYVKQVDVIMSHWSTGPEIMIPPSGWIRRSGRMPPIVSRSPMATPRISVSGTRKRHAAFSMRCVRPAGTRRRIRQPGS